jgi:hypothetical protein
MTAGSTSGDDASDPLPSYRRGLWFDESYITIRGLILNPSFAMSMWVRPTTGGNLFSISNLDTSDVGMENFLNAKFT